MPVAKPALLKAASHAAATSPVIVLDLSIAVVASLPIPFTPDYIKHILSKIPSCIPRARFSYTLQFRSVDFDIHFLQIE